MKARLALAVVLLTAWSIVAPAQRLARTAVPEHYDIHLVPDFATDMFAGEVTIKVRLTQPARTITLHAAEIDFHEVSIAANGTRQIASVALDPDKDTAALTVPQAVPPRRGRNCDSLHRPPQRSAARLLSEPRERPRLRHHAARAHRCAPCVSVVRRARDEGDLRRVCDDRSGTRRSRTGACSRTPWPAPASTHGSPPPSAFFEDPRTARVLWRMPRRRTSARRTHPR